MRPSIAPQEKGGNGKAADRMVRDIEPAHDHFAIIPHFSPKASDVLASGLSRRKDQTLCPSIRGVRDGPAECSKAPGAAAAAGVSSLLADRPRHDARGPRRRARS